VTTPVLSVALRGRGRHYPFPPADPGQWAKNRWGSLDPERLPDGFEFLPSVTNILSVLDKPALKYWAAEMAIREMHGNSYRDVEAAVRAHKNACDRVSKKRADAGTRAHTLAERLTQDHALPSSISEEDEAYADAYMAFWSDFQPVPRAVEATLYGDGYAGTADLIAELTFNFDTSLTVIDYKTRGVRDDEKIARYGVLYDENRMQLAALAMTTHLATLAAHTEDDWWLDEVGPTPCAAGVVLFPDGTYKLEEVTDIPRLYSAFMGALELWRGVKAA
jgi:hypothetical protein